MTITLDDLHVRAEHVANLLLGEPEPQRAEDLAKLKRVNETLWQLVTAKMAAKRR